MIFISHNHKDKEIVTPIANRLADIFGKETVFYDDWSLRPGDSLTKEVNKALQDTQFFFLFVTQNSLDSEMVSMEWQPALIKQTKGDCRFIPIRLQNIQMPSILADRIFIDAVLIGFEATIRQVVEVVTNQQREKGYTSEFSNLYWTIHNEGPNDMSILIHASYFMEPRANFLIMVPSNVTGVNIRPVPERMYSGGFQERPLHRSTENGVYIRLIGETLTPDAPLGLLLQWPAGVTPTVTNVLHQYKMSPFGGESQFRIVQRRDQ